MPPPPAPPTFPTRPGISGLAVGGLVCSLLMCVPTLSVVGTALSALALRDIRTSDKQGRGLAIAGLFVGIAVTLLWALGAVAAVAVYNAASAVSQSTARPFVTALAAGNLRGAAAFTDPASLPQADLDTVAAHLDQHYGPLESLSATGGNIRSYNGTTHYILTYTGTFARGSTALTITVAQTPAGPRVVACHVR